MSAMPGSITTLVNQISSGVAPVPSPALTTLQETLHTIARERVRTVGRRSEMRTADLVHEAYLKLFGRPTERPWQSRRHFYGSASRAMQQVVIDLVRRIEVRQRRDPHVAVPTVVLPGPFQSQTIRALLAALEQLELVDPVAAEVVRLRFMVGLGMEEVARVLNVPLRTTQRKWTLARAWLLARMEESGTSEL